MNSNSQLTQPILLLVLTTGAILLIPLLAMQFTDEVVWTMSDFIGAGMLLFGTGLMYILVTRKSGETAYRVAVGFALASGFFLIWANLAVGIIGSEENPFNLLYFGVIAVGLIGAFFARFRPQGMTLTMFAMAIAQALIAVIALIGEFYQSPPATVIHILGINGLFITLFVVSGLLFRYVAGERKRSKPEPVKT